MSLSNAYITAKHVVVQITDEYTTLSNYHHNVYRDVTGRCARHCQKELSEYNVCDKGLSPSLCSASWHPQAIRLGSCNTESFCSVCPVVF